MNTFRDFPSLLQETSQSLAPQGQAQHRPKTPPAGHPMRQGRASASWVPGSHTAACVARTAG